MKNLLTKLHDMPTQCARPGCASFPNKPSHLASRIVSLPTTNLMLYTVLRAGTVAGRCAKPPRGWRPGSNSTSPLIFLSLETRRTHLRQPLENIWQPILPVSTPSITSSSQSLPQHVTNLNLTHWKHSSSKNSHQTCVNKRVCHYLTFCFSHLSQCSHSHTHTYTCTQTLH